MSLTDPADLALSVAADALIDDARANALEALREAVPTCTRFMGRPGEDGAGVCGGDFTRAGDTYRCSECHGECSGTEGGELDRLHARIAELEAIDARDAAAVDRKVAEATREVRPSMAVLPLLHQIAGITRDMNAAAANVRAARGLIEREEPEPFDEFTGPMEER